MRTRSKSDEAQRPSQPMPAQAGSPQPEGGRRDEERGPNKLTVALKCFFLSAAVGLIFSTFLGIYMAFKFNGSRALVWGMLFLGTAIPLALIGYSILYYGDSSRRMQINEIFKILDGRIRMVDNIGLMEDGITTSGFTQ